MKWSTERITRGAEIILLISTDEVENGGVRGSIIFHDSEKELVEQWEAHVLKMNPSEPEQRT